jgi:D-alanyl-D-alanine carboxypeptidase (penicillin-binding protein 5/6)
MPTPTIKPISSISLPTKIVNKNQISWANSGNQVIGVVGYPLVNETSNQSSSPTASTIKLLLALLILNKHPLILGQQGPLITITDTDQINYLTELNNDESVVKVISGEKISEYQALQALLIASANNFAGILANWSFGSVNQYLVVANSYAKQLGMNSTIITDPSGYLTSTLSTPNDLALLGENSIQNPIISQIVSEYTATIPVAGLIKNYNLDLMNPSLRINGIKTGNTTSGGGIYIYSSNYLGENIVGVIQNATDLNTALNEAPGVLNSFTSEFMNNHLVGNNQVIGYYNVPWLGKINIYSQDSISVLTVPNQKYSIKISLDDLVIGSSSRNVGSIIISTGNNLKTCPLIIKQNINKPPFLWKLEHRFRY